jgi:HAD superfamily hydrolase (TIGR01549 family)
MSIVIKPNVKASILISVVVSVILCPQYSAEEIVNPTLLLDLDDTLLSNNVDVFIPKYLSVFSKYVSKHIEPDKFVRYLLLGTRAMVENRRPDCQLIEVFNDVFFQALDLSMDEFQPYADQFYAQVFPSLRGLTSSKSEAVRLVERAFAKGYRVVIATNPLFPLTAIEQRLEWAGLPVDKYPFELITSFESFHFAKPDPAYFAEILARIGWPEGGVVMVGDDLERDIRASRNLGLSAFWISNNSEKESENAALASASGALSDFWPWLERVNVGELEPDLNSRSAMMAVLRATPAVLDTMCRDLPPNLCKKRPQRGEWCLTEIFCHLRDVDREVNLPRLRKVLQENNPFLPGENTDLWAEERNYRSQDGRTALQQFLIARIKLLDFLGSLGDDDWQRPSRHAIFGPTQLSELVGIAAAHDRLHIRQFHKALAVVVDQKKDS